VTTAGALRTMMLDTIDRSVRWPDMVATMIELGVDSLIFTGSENLFHRLDCTANNFEVLALNPKNALLPATALALPS
jgi:[acyl-carrier-protein] S-malonyltransferase